MAEHLAQSDLYLGVAAAVSAVVAIVFAILVRRANPGGEWNRRLSALLGAEALLQATLALSAFVTMGGPRPMLAVAVPWLGLTVASTGYLLFATTLDGPVARALARRTVRLGLVAACVGSLAYTLVVAATLARDGLAWTAIQDRTGAPWIVFAAASLAALVVTLDAFRASPAGTPTRRRAKAYAFAFGLRDALYAIAVLSWAFGRIVLESEIVLVWSQLLSAVTPLFFVALLSYGILSTQLFDIDLKIKIGIKRSTVATIALVGVLAAAKVAEFYLSKTFGFVAGGIAAGAMLVLAPRLNKLGDKVANTAMPQVQPTPAYVQFKKLEVYRAAVEAAQEAGISEKEREMLTKLRAKLGITAEDAHAIESEATGA